MPGGAISLAGGNVDVEGKLAARSGSITVESTAHIAGDTVGEGSTSYIPLTPKNPSLFNLVLGSGAVLDTSGLWINDNGAVAASLIGGAYINGGSISLKTDARSAQCLTAVCKNLPGLGPDVPADVDLTGNIVISQGALFDVSSGGRVTDKDVLQVDSLGRAAGAGGNIALVTYAGGFSFGADRNPSTTAPQSAGILLAGSNGSASGNAQALASLISAAGFSQGGTFSVQAPAIAIGSDSSVPGAFSLPASFFSGNAFGAYSLSAVAAGLSVAPNTIVTLSQQNLLPTDSLLALPTGAKPSLATQTGSLPDYVRAPVNLTLSAALPLLPLIPYDDTVVLPPSNVVALTVGQGAVIQGEPRAVINLQVAGGVANAGGSASSGFLPPVVARLGVADILGAIDAPGGTVNITASQNAEIWLGAQSSINAIAGVSALTDLAPATNITPAPCCCRACNGDHPQPPPMRLPRSWAWPAQ